MPTGQRYSEEFKVEAVKQITERGFAVRDVAKRLGISEKSLHTWKRAIHGTTKRQDADDLDSMRRENARLKAELKRVEEERDILKKAAAYFAKASG